MQGNRLHEAAASQHRSGISCSRRWSLKNLSHELAYELTRLYSLINYIHPLTSSIRVPELARLYSLINYIHPLTSSIRVHELARLYSLIIYIHPLTSYSSTLARSPAVHLPVCPAAQIRPRRGRCSRKPGVNQV